MRKYSLVAAAAVFCGVGVVSCFAAPVITVSQGEEGDLPVLYSTNDILHGVIATELPGDQGWHGANSDPADRLSAFTDGQGMRSSGLTGLLADFPGAGNPAKRIEYAFDETYSISEIRVFTGNNGRDGRVFHAYTVAFSHDNGRTFGAPIYVQSHASGTLNNSQFNQWRVVLSQLTDDSGFLARNATHVRFDFYSVDNTLGQMRDPFNGINPFTGTDDGLGAAFVSPLVWEIDVIGEPGAPYLKMVPSGNDLVLTWLSSQGGFLIQSASDVSGASWQTLSPQPAVSLTGKTNRASLLNEGQQRYFRLSR